MRSPLGSGRGRATPWVAALVLAVALAGCTSAPRDAPGYDPSRAGTPVDGTVQAEAAVVAGIAAPRSAGAATLLLGEKQFGAPWPALVVQDARVAGTTGTLFLRGSEVRLEGPLQWTLGSLALSADNLTGFLRTDSTGPRTALEDAPAAVDAQRWREHSDASFWSDRLELRPGGAVTVNAAAVTLATPEGLRNLGTGAVVEGGTWRATAPARTEEAPAEVRVTEAAGPRVQLALAAPDGVLNLGTTHALALNQATVVDGRSPDLRLAPAPGGVRAEVRLVAFQIYHGGEPAIRAQVAIEPAEAAVPLQGGQGSVSVRVRETGGQADAVFRAVRTGGGGNVSMPGFQTVWDSWPPELRMLMLSGPWAVNFVFATVFMEGLRLLTGQYLPQPLLAGQQKEVTVSVGGASPGGEGSVVLEGRNFDDARLTLRYR